MNDPDQYFQGDVELSEGQAVNIQKELLEDFEDKNKRKKRKVGKVGPINLLMKYLELTF